LIGFGRIDRLQGEIMSFYVEDKGGNFERTPSGMHLASAIG